MKFVKKTVIDEASQWFKDGDHLAVKLWDKGGHVYKNDTPLIDTAAGKMSVSPGDWIVTDEKGNHHPYSQQDFEKMYDVAHAMDEKDPVSIINHYGSRLRSLVGEASHAGVVLEITMDSEDLLATVVAERDAVATTYCSVFGIPYLPIHKYLPKQLKVQATGYWVPVPITQFSEDEIRGHMYGLRTNYRKILEEAARDNIGVNIGSRRQTTDF